MSGAGVSGNEAKAGVAAITGGFVVAIAGVWMFAQQVKDAVSGLTLSPSGELVGGATLTSNASPPSPTLLLAAMAGWVVLTAGSVMLVVYAGRVRTHLAAAGAPIGTVGLWAAAAGTVLLTGSPLPALVVAGVTLHVAGSVWGTRLMQVASVGVVAQVAAMLFQKDDATAWLASAFIGIGGASLPLTAWPVLLTVGCTVASLVLMWAAAADTPTSRLVVEPAVMSSADSLRHVSRSVNHAAAEPWGSHGSTPAQEFALMGVGSAPSAVSTPASAPAASAVSTPASAPTAYPQAASPYAAAAPYAAAPEQAYAAAAPYAAAPEQAYAVASVQPSAYPGQAPVAPQPVSAAPASPAIPADWYPDPSGQAALRYWDGAAWTAHTA